MRSPCVAFALSLSVASLVTAHAQEKPADSLASVCADLTELNSVYFEARSSGISGRAEGRLAENVEILDLCPGTTIHIRAYGARSCGVDAADGNPRETSSARARAVRDWYLASGLGAERVLVCQGMGVDPGVCLKRDARGPDPRSRRADTMPRSEPAGAGADCL